MRRWFPFGARKAGKVEKQLEEILATLKTSLGQMHPVEKATVMLMANCMIEFAQRNHGWKAFDQPTECTPEEAGVIVEGLLSARGAMNALSQGHGPSIERYVSCHQKAAELVAVTVGLSISPAHAKGVASLWKAVWEQREMLRKAVPWLRKFEQTMQAEAVPRAENGRRLTDVDLLRLGQRLPAFLRSRRPASAQS